MRSRFLLLGVLPLLAAVARGDGDMVTRYAAIDALGRLNGVALQCRYIDQVRRMKAAVIEAAPKERSFGLAFDQATNRAFLAFIKQDRRCPGQAGFEQRVAERIEDLRRVFAAP